ncbi:MAG: SLBB domain-containing protein [Armatimonadetes bacterium]|nr:SLBB domain-containing protein [Armatimonadota bacterium]
MKINLFLIIFIFILNTLAFSQGKEDFRDVFQNKENTKIPRGATQSGNLEYVDYKTYKLDTGDNLVLSLYGKNFEEFKMTVNPIGKIYFPYLGDFYVRGLTLEQFDNKLNEILKKYYVGIKASVDLTSVRTFRVSILGEVQKPGNYLVDPFNRILDLIGLAEGITKIGSLANIELRRKGENKKVDIFRVMFLGEAKENLNLEPGDIIYVPARKDSVKILGEIMRPGIYELYKDKDSKIKDIMELSGGVTGEASIKNIWLERLTFNNQKKIIKGEELENLSLQNNDLIVIPSIALFQDTITLRGEFQYLFVSVKFPEVNKMQNDKGFVKKSFYNLKEGEKILDVINNVGGVTERANLSQAQIERLNANGEREIIKVDLYKLLVEKDLSQNYILLSGDIFSVPALFDVVFVVGEVRNSGAFPYNSKNIKEYIAQAGGFQEYARFSNIKIIRGDENNHKIFNFNFNNILQNKLLHTHYQYPNYNQNR